MAQFPVPERILKSHSQLPPGHSFRPAEMPARVPTSRFQPGALAWDARARVCTYAHTHMPRDGHHMSISPTFSRSETKHEPLLADSSISPPAPPEGPPAPSPQQWKHWKCVSTTQDSTVGRMDASSRRLFTTLSRIQVSPVVWFKDLLSHTCKTYC